MITKIQKLHVAGAMLLATAWSAPAVAERAYLDDANRRAPARDASVENLDHGYPRVLVHELDKSVPNDAYMKYDFIDAHGQHFPRVEKIQQQSPSTRMLRHISGRAYQSYNYQKCSISGGVAFETTTAASQGGPTSAGCGIYAGHWLYTAGTRTRQAINASAASIPVTDAGRFATGTYVVIYDSPAGSFKNAEHARVTGVNKSNNTITVSRGFKSTAKAHPTAAIVAEHVLGQGSDKELWAFNLSSQSPRDANGKTFGEFYADWLGNNLMRYDSGKQTSAKVAGVLFDADFYYELKNNKSDVNNDLVVDNGVAPGGANWLGEGLDAFYQRTTNRLPGKYVLTGVHDGRGYNSAYGTQMENWLDYGNGDFQANPKYGKLDELFAGYLFNMAERSQGPALVHNLSKTPTKAYKKGTNASSNAPFRLALGLTLMDDGYFGFHSNVAPDAWFDEYAVDVKKGSSGYGRAINKSNAAQVRQHMGWLGEPLGPFKRVYNDATFAPDKNLINNGSFDGNANGWAETNVNISRASGSAFEGSGALSVSPMINFKADLGGASAKSPTVSVVGGQAYTVSLAMRSSAPRDVRIALGNATARIPVGTKWRRYVLNMKPTKGGSTRLSINVGLEETQVWVDSVYLFKGDTNTFVREFQNGMVLANASNSSKTVSVGSNFRRISGTQEPSINNGQSVTSVSIPAYDGIVLVRREGASGGSSSTTTASDDGSGGGGSGGGGSESGDATSGGSGSGGSNTSGGSGGGSSLGDYVWTDKNRDGIQNNNESGLSGVKVKLRDCNGIYQQTAFTDGNGKYSFGNLAAGSYMVHFIAPAGMKRSPEGVGKEGADSDATGSGLTHCINLGKDDRRRGVDAGFH